MCYTASKIIHSLRDLPSDTTPARITAERFLQVVVERFHLRLEPLFDPQLCDKQAGFRHGQFITDQVFKLTYDVEHRLEENKSGIVLADLTAVHDSLLYYTGPNTPPPPLICCYFCRQSFKN